MPNLSAKALQCQHALREAADAYKEIVEQILQDPRGQFIAQLREAEEKVGEAAASYALAFVALDTDEMPAG